MVAIDRFLKAIEQVESGGDPDAVSSKGAIGRMQVMPATARQPGFNVKPARNKSEKEYTRVGRDYAKALLNYYDGNIEDALVAYNYGPTNANKWIDKGRKKKNLPSETRNYITKVKKEIRGNKTTKVKKESGGNNMSQALLTKFRKARQGSSEQKEILRRAKNDIRRAKLLNKKPSAALQTIIKEFKPETKAQLKQKQALAAEMGITLASGPILGKVIKAGRAGLGALRASKQAKQATDAAKKARDARRAAQSANKNKGKGGRGLTKLEENRRKVKQRTQAQRKPPPPQKPKKLGATLTGAGATAVGARELLKDSKPGPKPVAAKATATKVQTKPVKKLTEKEIDKLELIPKGAKLKPKGPVQGPPDKPKKRFEPGVRYIDTIFGKVKVDSSEKGMFGDLEKYGDGAMEIYDDPVNKSKGGTVKRRMGGKVRGYGKALRGY